MENYNNSKINNDKNYDRYLLSPLMSRFIYLNNLRIGVTEFYLSIVAALFATIKLSSGVGIGNNNIDSLILFINKSLRYGVFLLFFIGMLIYLFNLRCRGRSSSVAVLPNFWTGI